MTDRSASASRSPSRPAFSFPRLVLVAATTAALGVVATGCAVVRDQQQVGSYIDDATLTTRVKAKFAEDQTVSAMAIGVETFKGVVQLSGFAKSDLERERAERLARETSGVTAVRNDIVVRQG
jgi:hyperosmotically inducible periplasmic protein